MSTLYGTYTVARALNFHSLNSLYLWKVSFRFKLSAKLKVLFGPEAKCLKPNMLILHPYSVRGRQHFKININMTEPCQTNKMFAKQMIYHKYPVKSDIIGVMHQ